MAPERAGNICSGTGGKPVRRQGCGISGSLAFNLLPGVLNLENISAADGMSAEYGIA